MAYQSKRAEQTKMVAPVTAPLKPTGKQVPAKAPVKAPVKAPSNSHGKPAKPEKSDRRADEFPIISVLPKSDMQTVLGLMTMDLELAAMEKQAKAERADGKAKIHEIIVRNNLEATGGLRWGQLAVYDSGIVSRPSCTLENFIKALLETGMVTADLVDECREAATKDGEEYLDLKVADLSRPASGKG